uniref:Uncharacterized protein n=1 Tax=Marseillevirus LCMAC103 TaxID=2506604 RepID=A0A481YUK4_9VIRU|nr:MAG: hypothetical protein LCMAC103_02000 [Marseillevirus LCMAC103]
MSTDAADCDRLTGQIRDLLFGSSRVGRKLVTIMHGGGSGVADLVDILAHTPRRKFVFLSVEECTANEVDTGHGTHGCLSPGDAAKAKGADFVVVSDVKSLARFAVRFGYLVVYGHVIIVTDCDVLPYMSWKSGSVRFIPFHKNAPTAAELACGTRVDADRRAASLLKALSREQMRLETKAKNIDRTVREVEAARQAARPQVATFAERLLEFLAEPEL